MAKYSDDDQVVADSSEDSGADNAMPYSIGRLGIDFGDVYEEAENDSPLSEYEEIDPEASVEDAANKKKSKKASADDAIAASSAGPYKDPFLDALAYDRPETDGLSPGYE